MDFLMAHSFGTIHLGNFLSRPISVRYAMKRFAVFAIVAAVLIGSTQSSADEAISITVRPTIAPYRGSAQLRVLVTRDDKNRTLVWEVDGPSYYRSSLTELNGASAPRSYFFIVKDLPAGEFEVRATVRRNDRTSAMDRGIIRVVGGPG